MRLKCRVHFNLWVSLSISAHWWFVLFCDCWCSILFIEQSLTHLFRHTGVFLIGVTVGKGLSSQLKHSSVIHHSGPPWSVRPFALAKPNRVFLLLNNAPANSDKHNVLALRPIDLFQPCDGLLSWNRRWN